MKKDINISLLRLAFPNILSNISTPLLATVDTVLMGAMSSAHLAAVGLGSMIFSFVYWNFGFLRMGTTGLTANAYGAEDKIAQGVRFGQATLIALTIAFIFLILQGFVGAASLNLMSIKPELQNYVGQYFYTRAWDAPATLMLFVCMGWFFGMQNAIFPLIITIFINVINIGLSWYFVRVLNLGTEGVAMGTVVAQYAGLALALALLFWKYGSIIKAIRWKAVIDLVALRQFLHVNRDIFIRTLCLTFSFGLFYRSSAAAGTEILAINTVLMQFVNWMSYGVDGFAYASESLVGRFKGAKDVISLKKTVRLAFAWGMGMALGIMLYYWIEGMELAAYFSADPQVLEGLKTYLPWVILFPLLATPCYIWDGVFVGLAASTQMRNTMILSFILFILSYFALKPLGNHGLWAALLVFMVARGLTMTVAYGRGRVV